MRVEPEQEGEEGEGEEEIGYFQFNTFPGYIIHLIRGTF